MRHFLIVQDSVALLVAVHVGNECVSRTQKCVNIHATGPRGNFAVRSRCLNEKQNTKYREQKCSVVVLWASRMMKFADYRFSWPRGNSSCLSHQKWSDDLSHRSLTYCPSCKVGQHRSRQRLRVSFLPRLLFLRSSFWGVVSFVYQRVGVAAPRFEFDFELKRIR